MGPSPGTNPAPQGFLPSPTFGERVFLVLWGESCVSGGLVAASICLFRRRSRSSRMKRRMLWVRGAGPPQLVAFWNSPSPLVSCCWSCWPLGCAERGWGPAALPAPAPFWQGEHRSCSLQRSPPSTLRRTSWMAARRTRVWTRVQRNGGFHATVPRWGEGRGDAGCRFWDAGFGMWDAGFGM